MSLKRKHDHEPSAQPAVASIHHGLASETDDAADRRFESLYEKTCDFKDLAILDPEFSAV